MIRNDDRPSSLLELTKSHVFADVVGSVFSIEGKEKAKPLVSVDNDVHLNCIIASAKSRRMF